MELTKLIMQWIRKYRFVVLIFLVGIGLMLIPFGSNDAEKTANNADFAVQTDLQEELNHILGQIEGAGKVSVLLSVRTSQQTVYQTDESESGSGSSYDTVIITDENRTQSGLIQQILYPEYRGAIVVCQGADNMQVRLSIMEAVSRITGLGMDKISVLKMK